MLNIAFLTVEDEDGKPVRKGTVIGKLFSELGPRYLERPGGYTRIIHLSLRRLGDNGQLVLLQLIGEDEGPKRKGKSTSRKRSRGKAKETPEVEKTVEPQEVAGAGQTAEVEEAAQVEQADEAQRTSKAQQTDQSDDADATQDVDTDGDAEISEASDEADRAEQKE